MERVKTQPAPPGGHIKRWIIGIWTCAVIFAAGFSIYFISNNQSGALPAPLPSLTPSLTPKRTPIPTATATPQPPTPTTFLSTPTLPAKAVLLSPTPPSPIPPTPHRFVIGQSVAGRPLEMVQFGHGEIKRLIVAGIHGGYEMNTIALADELIAHLQSHPNVIPPQITLYILRSLNPDGAARSNGIAGRANENGVDLNRNFPNRWQADWPLEGCWSYAPITAGSGPASEPEVQALISFVQEHKLDALISYHSAALGIFPGGQPPTAPSVSLAEDIAAVSDYPYPPLDLGCQFTGQLVDWAAELDIAAVDIELANHQDTDFDQNLIILYKFLNWSYPE